MTENEINAERGDKNRGILYHQVGGNIKINGNVPRIISNVLMKTFDIIMGTFPLILIFTPT